MSAVGRWAIQDFARRSHALRKRAALWKAATATPAPTKVNNFSTSMT